MSFFSNIFRRGKNTAVANKPDIDALLASADSNGSIITLDNYIGGICAYGDELDILTEPQKNFYLNQNLEREVNNGGFGQFFFNSSGKYAHETVLALKAIGAHKTADLVQEAIAEFPGSSVPRDRVQRDELFNQIYDKSKESWDKLDSKFYLYQDNLNELNLLYINANRGAF